MTDEQLNRAIDRAVREMLDVESPADLRARVIERIDRPAAAGWRLRVLAPVGAAMIFIASIIMWLPSRHTPVTQTAQIPHAPVTIPREPMHPAIGPPEVSRAKIARVESARARRVTGVRRGTAIVSNAPTESNVAPLDPIAPIRVAAVAQSDIAPRPISIEPLAPIAQVQIAPLTPPDGRH